ncbi:MAG: hypothetical protein R2788_20845 [Saprospiraceae bacterium]
MERKIQEVWRELAHGLCCSGFVSYIMRNYDVPVSGPSCPGKIGQKNLQRKTPNRAISFFQKNQEW